jgi:predicted metal-dependent hydrolase
MDFWQRKNSKTFAKSNGSTHELIWEGHAVQVESKDIRSLRLILTPTGIIKAKVPYQFSDEDLLVFLQKKSAWIHKHLERIQSLLAKQPADFSVIPFLGVSYPSQMHISSVAPRVVLNSDNTIHLFLKLGTAPEKLEAILDTFYRMELKKRMEPLVHEWEPILGVQVHEICYKRMKTRWGTCNVIDHRIWFNTELAKYSFPCLEYIVVHEMCHLLERGHGPAFKALMDKHLPHWKQLRQELNGKGVRY